MTPRAGRTLAWALAASLVAIATLVALAGAPWEATLRHAYFLPVMAGALGFGVTGGVLTAAAAVLLSAPSVLPAIERTGVTPEATDGLATLTLLALVGSLTGVLTTRAARQQARHEALVAIQRALADDAPLEVALARVRACLGARLRAADLALVVTEGEQSVIAGGAAIAPGSLAARVLEGGEPVFASDTGNDRRPRRAFGAPLVASGRLVGALLVERVGELDADERAALEALGAHVGLALENARLASRQRRFADELEEKVRSATRRLEEVDRAKSTFVAIASHELRTPLTALLGFSELLATRRFPLEDVQRFAEVIRGETERLVRIVNDLLDLSRLERGLEPVLRRTPVAVERVLAAVVDLFRRMAPRHRFDLECERPLPRVDADPDALDRIVKNLVSNAVKYSPPGSAVRLRARRIGAGAVEITVEDEGQGIASAELPRIFEPYYRAPGAGAAARGAGLGLAVVKSLVDAHGGAIEVQSEPNTGTRVTFRLPVVP